MHLPVNEAQLLSKSRIALSKIIADVECGIADRFTATALRSVRQALQIVMSNDPAEKRRVVDYNPATGNLTFSDQPEAWVYLPPPEWTDAQRRRARGED